MTKEELKSAILNKISEKTLRKIFKDVYGFHYFNPKVEGAYQANDLRNIAECLDMLDEYFAHNKNENQTN